MNAEITIMNTVITFVKASEGTYNILRRGHFIGHIHTMTEEEKKMHLDDYPHEFLIALKNKRYWGERPRRKLHVHRFAVKQMDDWRSFAKNLINECYLNEKYGCGYIRMGTYE